MMIGGLFMFGFGLLAMLIVIGLPIALIAVIIWISTNRGNSTKPASAPGLHNLAFKRTCSHCGTDLQIAWSHCPQCGAQI
jgi:hypothetical protein